MTDNRPTAKILSLAELGPAYLAKIAREGRPDEQAEPFQVRFADRDCLVTGGEENERLKRNAKRTEASIATLKPSDSEGD